MTILRQKIVYCAYSNTIRLFPENYLIAHKNPRYNCWQLDPDLACPVAWVFLVTQSLMVHSQKYNTDGENTVYGIERLQTELERETEPNYFKQAIERKQII